MKRFGCVLGIAGLLACIASFVLFGTSIFKAFAAREVVSVPIAVGEPADTGVVSVDTALLCQVAIAAEVRSEHVQRGAGSDGKLELRYAFPFRYTVYDESGNVVAREEVDFASDGGMRTNVSSRVTDDGGSESLERSYEKFAVPAPGNVRIVAQIDADRDFGAALEEARLVVYDNVSKHASRVIWGVVLLVCGGLAGLAGAMLFLFAVLRK